MKFAAVVGNPPYQLSDGGAQASARPIYQHFVQLGSSVSSGYTSFIIPTRWYAGGKGLEAFRARMLSDCSLRELHDCLTPETIFAHTNNRGGVCYFLTDKAKTHSPVRVVTHAHHQVVADLERELLLPDLDIFIRDGIALNVVLQVLSQDFTSLASVVSARKPFGIVANAVKTAGFARTPQQLLNPVTCVGKGRQLGYVERAAIQSRDEWIDRWKVLVPRANNIGTELKDDNLNSFVVAPGTLCTESYLVVGATLDLNEAEAQALSKYLQTKFVRFLHKQAKVSQDATSKTYRFVPLQDFRAQDELDWNARLELLDAQLYKKYQLTTEQINYINTNIKNMHEQDGR